jgi:hypothetical protein
VRVFACVNRFTLQQLGGEPMSDAEKMRQLHPHYGARPLFSHSRFRLLTHLFVHPRLSLAFCLSLFDFLFCFLALRCAVFFVVVFI